MSFNIKIYHKFHSKTIVTFIISIIEFVLSVIYYLHKLMKFRLNGNYYLSRYPKKKKIPNESHFNILTQQKNKTKVYKIIVK